MLPVVGGVSLLDHFLICIWKKLVILILFKDGRIFYRNRMRRDPL